MTAIRYNASLNSLDPDYEWETAISSDQRVDVLMYDHTQPALGPIQVLEIKGTWNPTLDGVGTQLGDYVATLNGLGMNAIPAVFQNSIAYYDKFKIKLDPCESGDPQRFETYDVYPDPGIPGVLLVNIVSRDPCNNPNDTPPKTDETEETVQSWDAQSLGRLKEACAVCGDPHITTIDGLAYDMQSVGEFDLIDSSQLDLQIQARFVRPGPATWQWSELAALAIRAGDHRLELRPDGTVLVDGSSVSMAVGDSIDVGTSELVRGADSVFYVLFGGYPTGGALRYSVQYGTANLALDMPSGAGDFTGLLGDGNGDPRDDLKLRDGTPLGAHPTASEIYGTYANSWRITDASSLFTYADGRNTEYYTDLTFPQSVFTINDISAGARAAASDICTQNAVPVGPQFDDCVIDVTLTSNSDFAAMASEATRPSIDPNDTTVDSVGDLSLDFEGALPHNFQAAEMTHDDATGTFAGPFSGNGQYQFYLPDLPPHASGSVSFDMLALGDWTDSLAEKVALRLNDATVWSFTNDGSNSTTPIGSGTLANGIQYTRYRFTVPFDDWQRTLSATYSAANVDGLNGKGFGIDNVELHLAIVPPQTFDLGSLGPNSPLTISDAVPGPGAGNLETKASQDQYTFTLDRSREIYIDSRTCPSGTVHWTLLDQSGAAHAESWSCGDRRISLEAGTYQLDVTVDLEHTGPYSMQLFVVPDPQVFDLGTLSPGTSINISNGVPGPGAGNLETKASQDQYTFTLDSPDEVYLDSQSCPPGGSVHWTLLEDTTGGSRSQGWSCSDGRVELGAGSYRLVVSVDLELVGPYSMQLFIVPPPDVFGIAVDASSASISNGVPGPGAGNLETKASEDEYTFSLVTQETIYVDVQTCPGSLYWQVVNADTGSRMARAWSCSDGQVSLPGGNFRLEVSVDLEHTGAYSMNVLAVPDPQMFNLGPLVSGSPVNISNGVPGPGAGNLETKASEDEYTFSLDASHPVYVDVQSCPGSLYWELINDDTGTRAARAWSCGDGQVSLPAGHYRLNVSVDLEHTGPYSIQLFVVPPTQVFNLGPLTTASPANVSNGVPGPGAGNLETQASEDQYTFTVDAAHAVYVDVKSCPGSLYWQLFNDDTGVRLARAFSCNDGQVSVPAGHFRLKVSVDLNVGLYSLQLFIVPDPQLFDLGALVPGSPASISNGVPGPGAGNLETVASQDQYTFSLDAARSVTLSVRSCPGSLYWELINDDTGVRAARAWSCNGGQVNLPSGHFRLKVSPDLEHVGSYAIQLSAA